MLMSITFVVLYACTTPTLHPAGVPPSKGQVPQPPGAVGRKREQTTPSCARPPQPPPPSDLVDHQQWQPLPISTYSERNSLCARGLLFLPLPASVCGDLRRGRALSSPLPPPLALCT